MLSRSISASLLAVLFFVPVPGYAELELPRQRMVQEQVEARGIKDRDVLSAMNRVERHQFVPVFLRPLAYEDGPLPIGENQTISQPYIVALMTELLAVDSEDRVLEIGTGSGYQAAVLAEIAKEVYTIEILPSLAASAEKRLAELGHTNVHVKTGDGYLGWPEEAPFDGIMLTAAPDEIPTPLVDQLKVGGRIVAPIGEFPNQVLYVIQKTKEGLKKEEIIPVRFVPMTGIAQERNEVDFQNKIG
ncbi:MAG: protein-L-isoaspartate(D-aspartate) O-methyltransferase [Candidatus Omnitrophica bacterium]|nr:protein-L-isoaspartate(D-aspartate) O-methyltransferase [Candidatus Omnitrophota bacterium]